MNEGEFICHRCGPERGGRVGVRGALCAVCAVELEMGAAGAAPCHPECSDGFCHRAYEVAPIAAYPERRLTRDEIFALSTK